MNIGVSAFFLLGILKLYKGVLHLVGACLCVYGIAYFRVGGRKYMPWIAFISCMLHMLYTYVEETVHVPLLTQQTLCS